MACFVPPPQKKCYSWYWSHLSFLASFLWAQHQRHVESTEIYKWIRIEAFIPAKRFYKSEINAQLLSERSTQTISSESCGRCTFIHWADFSASFYSFGLQQNLKFWRNLSSLYASETGPVSLRSRVPVWTFVSAVHLQTRLVLAETAKSLEQTPSAHYFSIHSDPLSLAFVSDVMRKQHVKALKLGSYIWTLRWVLLIVIITVQDRRGF